MTENKRFIIKPDGINQYTVSDKLNQFGLPITNEMHCKVIAYALNELHNKYIDEYALRETLQLDLQRVEEENKELKAQLYCDEDGVCNICKHQQLIPDKVMQGYYTAKCEKGHKECSKEDLRYCDDFKLKELSE